MITGILMSSASACVDLLMSTPSIQAASTRATAPPACARFTNCWICRQCNSLPLPVPHTGKQPDNSTHTENQIWGVRPNQLRKGKNEMRAQQVRQSSLGIVEWYVNLTVRQPRTIGNWKIARIVWELGNTDRGSRLQWLLSEHDRSALDGLWQAQDGSA